MADCRLVIDGDGIDFDLELAVDWSDDAPEIRDAVAAALPLEGEATRWGDELYVRTPVDVELDRENARLEVPEGAIAYWPTGDALCLFWGPTPASVDEEPRAASPVNVVATVADPSSLSELEGVEKEGAGGTTLRLEAIADGS
ncbi:cyclophilin-like family protein [Halomontanus rarus]|uniref:cyclophilin-like family protein n=1 Tax=Halomontanus rarus TaxID=3034020 RepID=UPI001A98438B